eukprot:CAMPEP_0197686700 /NCGR_PEP_ID=MMETSP1338-20131121/102880_1 /TAXON_ID=43686 ORGANISM="Pelagodinium beii, Strain RCC1491" /NCGR_SAMPLE_ID=MMETSP1338 /ASSEMBLY_ACC=CAM_ASM_000754 /LENGTH=218 /DNA_ID=CAMNT_0043268669 /DNA_START=414 /DNA_END=1073 /DNA_ORIENTATION=-
MQGLCCLTAALHEADGLKRVPGSRGFYLQQRLYGLFDQHMTTIPRLITIDAASKIWQHYGFEAVPTSVMAEAAKKASRMHSRSRFEASMGLPSQNQGMMVKSIEGGAHQPSQSVQGQALDDVASLQPTVFPRVLYNLEGLLYQLDSTAVKYLQPQPTIRKQIRGHWHHPGVSLAEVEDVAVPDFYLPKGRKIHAAQLPYEVGQMEVFARSQPRVEGQF